MMDTGYHKEEGELEDGEISSDEEKEVHPPQNSEEAVDYVLNERPTSWTETLKKQGQSSSTADPSQQYQPPLRPTRPEPLTDYNDDDDNSGGTSSSEDSDEDGPLGKKTKRMGDPSMAFKTPSHPPSRKQDGFSWSSSNPFEQAAASSERNDSFKNQASMFQQKRKPNNIWSTLLEDQEVSDIFGKVNVKEADGSEILIDRGPESFSIQYNQRPLVRRRSDSSSLSSGGLSDNELDYLKGQLPEDLEVTASVSVEEVSDDALPEKFGSRALKRRRNPQVRCRKKMKAKMIRRLKKMKPEMLGKYMAEKLTEPKHKLLVKAITLLGKEACIFLFLKTMKIERRGGLLIKNQERRRTPGGVFFYLLRGDRKYSRNLVDKIFEEDRFVQTKNKKKENASKRIRRKAKLEAKQRDFESEHKREICDEGDFQVNQECMEEDSDGSLPVDPNESEVDSDEYYKLEEQHEKALIVVGASRGLVSYEAHEDCLDLHCDPVDLA